MFTLANKQTPMTKSILVLFSTKSNSRLTTTDWNFENRAGLDQKCANRRLTGQNFHSVNK